MAKAITEIEEKQRTESLEGSEFNTVPLWSFIRDEVEGIWDIIRLFCGDERRVLFIDG